MSAPDQPPERGLRPLLRTFPVPVLLTLAALSAVSPMATDMYLPAFTTMATELQAGASQIQLTLTTFMVGVAIGQLVFGVMSDRLGRRPLILWGTVMAILAGVGTVIAPTLELLLVARFFQGLGGAAGMVLARAVITDRARGIAAAQALNLVMAIMGVAPVLAPTIGGFLNEIIGWRGIMAVVVGFTVLLLILVLAFLPESLPPGERTRGGFGALIRGAGELLKNGYYRRLLILSPLIFGLLMAHVSGTPFIIQRVLGYSATTYAVIFGVCAASIILGSTIASALARRIAPHRQARIAVLLLLVVDLIFGVVSITVLASPTDSAAIRAVALVLLVAHVFVIGLCLGNVSALVLTEAGRRAGTGSAMLGFTQFLIGGLVSPLVGLSGQDSAVAFGVAIIGLVLIVNLLALPGFRPMREDA